MRPIESFLATLHPEAMQRGLVLINGNEIEFGQPDNKVLRRLVREHHAAGQEALASFRKWLVRTESLKQQRADVLTSTVWNVMCMTYDAESGKSNPMALLNRADHTYNYDTKMQIVRALRLWAQFSKDSALYEQLLLWAKRKPNVAPQYVLDTLASTPPYTRAEYRRVLKALEEFKGSPRYPWAWPCLRITFTFGASLPEIVLLERTRVKQALSGESALLRIGVARSQRVIPVAFIEEELKFLDSFPYEWGVIGDLVDPAKTTSGRGTYSTMPLKRIVKLVFRRAKVEHTITWNARMRWSAAWQYYQKTENLVGAAQILGRRDIRRASEFIEELKRRAAAAKAEKDEASESATIEP